MQNFYKLSRDIVWIIFLNLGFSFFSNGALFANIDEMEKVTEKVEMDLKKFGHVISTADGHLSFHKKSPTPSEFGNLILGYLHQYPSVEVSGYMVIGTDEAHVKETVGALAKAGVFVKEINNTQLRLTIDNIQSLKLISKSLSGQSVEVISIDLQFNPVDGEE